MSLLLLWLLASNPKNHCEDQCPGAYPLGFLLRALMFQLMLSHIQINILKYLGRKVLKIHTTYISSPMLTTKVVNAWILTRARRIIEINQLGWVSVNGSWCNLKNTRPSYEKGSNLFSAQMLTALWNYVLTFRDPLLFKGNLKTMNFI